MPRGAALQGKANSPNSQLALPAYVPFDRYFCDNEPEFGSLVFRIALPSHQAR